MTPGAPVTAARRPHRACGPSVLALCGNYHTVSFVANTAELAGESWGARFPNPD